MKTIILLSTQTSATGSICRVINTINGSKRIFYGLGEEKLKIIGPKLNKIPKKDHIVLHNRPDLLKFIEDPNDYRYIVNFRDPRDRLCNKYYWVQQHEAYPRESIEQIKSRARLIEEQGIDNWIQNACDPSYELALLNFVESLNTKEVCINTYIDLCTKFDSFISKLGSFMGESITKEKWDALEPERCDKLSENKEWIGSQWKGADTDPGRYKRELSADTVNILNEYYHEVLMKMSRLDPENKRFYLQGVGADKNEKFRGLGGGGQEPADILRETALAFEHSGDLETALKVMLKAKVMRSNGPKILRKIDEYQTKLELNKE